MAKSVAKLKKDADKFFSKAIRLRDADQNGLVECITCGVRRPWKQMHAGHFVKRAVNVLRFDEENVNGQCPQCNIYKYGEQYQYAKNLDLKYGVGTAEKLASQRFTSHKFTIPELEEIVHDSKEQIRYYENNS